MSFNNTKTPLKPTGKAKHQLPKRKEERLALEEKVRRYVRIGLDNPTNLHRSCYKFTRRQTCYRHGMKRLGYILGDMGEFSGERYVIYYDSLTDRHMEKESHAGRYGFVIKEMREQQTGIV